MKAQRYSQKTDRFALPVLGYGDVIEPEVELEKWQRVENLFLSCLRGEQSTIFKEGNLNLSFDGGGIIKATLSSNGQNIICRGIAGGRYFDAVQSLVWSPMYRGSFYYLYLTTMPETIADASLVKTHVSTTLSPSENIALIATVDLRKDEYLVDRSPAGKNVFENLRLHIEDNKDPHGALLYQTGLVVENSLEANSATIGELRVGSLVVGDRVLKFRDAPYLYQHVEEYDLPVGLTKVAPSGDFKIVFAQCLNNHDNLVVFEIGEDGSYLDIHNKTGKNTHVSIMLTEEQL